MDQLVSQVGQWLSGAFGPALQIAIRVAVAYVVLVWLATALWVFADARRRSTHAFVAYLDAGLVVVATPLLFPLAVVVHAIVRPAATVAERRVQRLRAAALGLEVDGPRCSGCGVATDGDWLVCPNCRAALRHRCAACGRAGELDWAACAWCGSPIDAPTDLVRAET